MVSRKIAGLRAELIDLGLECLFEPDVPALKLASLEQYLHDPAFHKRFLEWLDGDDTQTPRTPYTPGTKTIAAAESDAKNYKYFAEHQEAWSTEFRERLADELESTSLADEYIAAIRELWIDGRAKRQSSPEMFAIKASICDHDAFHFPTHDMFVREHIGTSIKRMLDPLQMYQVFELNESMMQRCIDDYLGSIADARRGSINRLYVHRGIFPTDRIKDKVMIELHYLSSYSLATSVAEVFAQTYPTGSRGKGFPTMMAAPLPLVMPRIVAFAPFITKMAVGQLELVIAPPPEPFPLRYNGAHGSTLRFHEYQYDVSPSWTGPIPDEALRARPNNRSLGLQGLRPV